jgi:hypothetical protein
LGQKKIADLRQVDGLQETLDKQSSQDLVHQAEVSSFDTARLSIAKNFAQGICHMDRGLPSSYEKDNPGLEKRPEGV